MSGDDLGLVEYQAPTVDRGDVVELPNGTTRS
jgi:hypothetical protein